MNAALPMRQLLTRKSSASRGSNHKITARLVDVLAAIVVCVTIAAPLRGGDRITAFRPLHQSGSRPSEGLTLSIGSTDGPSRVGAPLAIWVKLKNTGKQALLVRQFFVPHSDFFLSVYDERGNVVKYPRWNLHIYSVTAKLKYNFAWLATGSFCGSDTVGEWYPIRLAQPGTYYVEAMLSVIDESEDLGVKHWYGTIRSKRIRITVEAANKRKPSR